MLNELKKRFVYGAKLARASRNPVPYEKDDANRFPEEWEKKAIFASNESDYKLLLNAAMIYIPDKNWRDRVFGHEKSHADKAIEIYGESNISVRYGIAFAEFENGEIGITPFTDINLLNGRKFDSKSIEDMAMAPESPSASDYVVAER